MNFDEFFMPQSSCSIYFDWVCSLQIVKQPNLFRTFRKNYLKN